MVYVSSIIVDQVGRSGLLTAIGFQTIAPKAGAPTVVAYCVVLYCLFKVLNFLTKKSFTPELQALLFNRV